jgi:hypothetical protein
VAIRNLIQLPHGGQVFLPTYALSEPRTLFGEIPSQRLQPTDTCVRFSASFPGEHKFAVRAAAVTGRIGYVWQEGREWALLVRNFAVDPSGEYVDVPRDDPEDFGYAVHVASIDSPLGKFCELGYHAPAIGLSTNQVRGEDVSQVWAFRGEEQKVRELARRLLGAS